MAIKQTIFLICILLSAAASVAQDPFFKQFHPNRDNVNLKVNCVSRDGNGYLWLGTSEGIYKFDGTEYFLFNADENNDVTSVCSDQIDKMWIGFRNGSIATIVNDELIAFNPEEGVPKKAITYILCDKDGRMWFTTAGEGVYVYKNKRLYNIDTGDGLNDNYTYSALEDKQGQIWIGTDQGIAVCRPWLKEKVSETLNRNTGLPDEIVRALAADDAGNIWIGMQDKGICMYNSNKKKIEVPVCFSEWKHGQVNGLLTGYNEIWIATEENGIINCRLTGKNNFRSWSSYGNFSFPAVNNIIRDDEGNLWMSSGSGLIRSHGNWLTFLSELKNQKIDFVHSIYCDSRNNLLFTPDQELILMPQGDSTGAYKKFAFTPPEDLIDIISIYEDKCGYYWIGTMGRGLFRLNAANGEQFAIAGIADEYNSILSIAGDDSSMWLGTFSGVLKLSITEICNFRKPSISIRKFENQKELGNYFIYSVFIDSHKRVWFGTDQQGITWLDHEKFYNLNDKNGLNGNTVYAIAEDEGGRTWFSVQNSGIYRYDGRQLKQYSVADGLRDLNITSLVAAQDKIFMIHHRGVDILHPATGKIVYYGAENNLAEINPDINAITKDNNGRIWFGTEKGIVVFDPARNPDPAGPKIILNKVSLFGQKENVQAERVFPYDRNYLSFDFTGIWFTDPEKIRYQYKLEGYNPDWIETRDKRIIFPNLQPGDYTFKVRSSLNSAFNFTDEVSYSFVVQKPFWKETWFRILAFIVALAMVITYLKQRDSRTRQIEALKKEKVEFQFETLKSQVNPHFLFNSFNTLITIIEDHRENAVEYVEKLSEFFRSIVDYREKELITLKEELTIMSTYFFLQKKRFGNHISLKIEVDEKYLSWQTPPLALQILLENAIKHNVVSHESPLQISISSNGTQLLVKNNINPKLSVEPSTGTGLHNIVNRYKFLAEDEIKILNDGKEFTVYLPLIKP